MSPSRSRSLALGVLMATIGLLLAACGGAGGGSVSGGSSGDNAGQSASYPSADVPVIRGTKQQSSTMGTHGWNVSVKVADKAAFAQAVKRLEAKGFVVIGKSAKSAKTKSYSLSDATYSVRLGITPWPKSKHGYTVTYGIAHRADVQADPSASPTTSGHAHKRPGNHPATSR